MTSPSVSHSTEQHPRISVKQRLLALAGQARVFPGDRSANIAIWFAFMCIPILGAIGVAIDYANAQAMRTQMQTALDAAVLAGIAQEPGLQIDRARAVFNLNFVDPSVRLDSSFTPNPDGSFSGRVATNIATTVTALIGVDSLRIESRATASLRHERSSVCLLALDPSRSPALLVNNGAEFIAPDCEIHIRSTGNPALTMNALATLDVARICVRGTNILNNGGPRPVETACATIDDPYRGHLPTPPLDCTLSDLPPFSGSAVTLSPGTYCGNLIFNGTPVVTLMPGVYVIRGNMILNTGSTLRGQGVSFYFPNSNATLQASGGIRIELSAPTSGAFAGLLMSEPPGLNRSDFVLNSSLGHKLEGLIYLPSRDVTFNAMSGATTDPTAMVVNSLILNQGRWRLGGGTKAMSTQSSRYSAYLID